MKGKQNNQKISPDLSMHLFFFGYKKRQKRTKHTRPTYMAKET